jgi:peptidoglycan/LPS O-acetylase OafA/YrhL
MKQKVFFPNLDAIRFIAFFLVFFYHGYGEAFKLFSIHINNLGSIGVSIFFVLSGFLITYLILTEIRSTGKIHVVNFYIRRALRIWPLYYAVVIGVFILYPFLQPLFQDHSTTSSNPFYYFFFLSNFDVIHTQRFFNGNDYLVSNTTWSVAVEEQFYLLWPLFFYFLNKRFYPFVLWGFLFVCYTFRWIFREDVLDLYFHSLSVCGDLALGGLAAYYAFSSNRFQLFFKTITPKKQFFIFAFLFALLACSYFFPQLKFQAPFGRLAFTLLFAFLILQQCFAEQPLFALSRFTFISKWGRYTYGLYLLHTIALLATEYVFGFVMPDRSGLIPIIVTGTVGFLVSLLISYISYTYYESYFLRLKKKFTFVQTLEN